MGIQKHQSWLPPGFLTTLERVASIWRALDEDCTGWASFRAFDLLGFEALVAFKKWTERRFGGAFAAFRKMDPNGTGKLKLWQMRKFLASPDGFDGDIDLVVESLDMNFSGSLSENHMTWLDSWDLVYEESDPLVTPRA